jgi:hypothetical protein
LGKETPTKPFLGAKRTLLRKKKKLDPLCYRRAQKVLTVQECKIIDMPGLSKGALARGAWRGAPSTNQTLQQFAQLTLAALRRNSLTT